MSSAVTLTLPRSADAIAAVAAFVSAAVIACPVALLLAVPFGLAQ